MLADSTVDFFWPTTDVSLLNGNAFETDLRSELQTETSLTDSDLSITTVVLAGDCVQTTVQGRKALVDSALVTKAFTRIISSHDTGTCRHW